MKQQLTSVLAVALMTASAFAAEQPDLKDPKKKSSYAVGVSIGTNFKRQEIDLDAASLAAGIRDAMGGKPALSETEIREVLTAFDNEMRAKAMDRQKVMADKNLKDGEAFLAANAKKDGVKTTASGLQYKVIKSGSGKTPKSSDTVKTHYHGTLIDGTVFDSSVQRGEPISFPVNGVIPGWTEALQLMKEGDKWQIYVPAKLAYGERGAGREIGPNSTLIFDVELIAVEKAQ